MILRLFNHEFRTHDMEVFGILVRLDRSNTHVHYYVHRAYLKTEHTTVGVPVTGLKRGSWSKSSAVPQR